MHSKADEGQFNLVHGTKSEKNKGTKNPVSQKKRSRW